MPIRPNLLESLVFFTTNQGPGPIFDIWSALGLPVVQAAVELGVFADLHQSPASPAELAERLQIDAQGAELLLPALEALGYVRRKDGQYINSAMTTKWLTPAATIDFSPGFRFWGEMVPRLWHRLADTLRAGAPAVNLYTWIEDQPELSRHFQEWMVALAKFGQDEVLDRLPLPAHARRLLDVGGGHALYSIAFCRRNPALQATVMDSPRALEAAQANITEAGLAERITVYAGNFLADPLPAGQDAVLLFNIVHGFSSEQNQTLLEKASAALNPGGQVVILEQLTGGGVGPASTAINRLLGLNYYHLLGGRIYPYETVVHWMEQAGLGAVRRVDLRKVPGVSLVIGSKG